MERHQRHPEGVAPVRVAALTGLVVSGAYPVRRERVDRESGRVTVHGMKTGSRAHRFEDTAPAVVRIAAADHGHVFAFDARRPLTCRTARTRFAAVERLAGVDGARLPGLRPDGPDEHGAGCRRARAARPARNTADGDGGPVVADARRAVAIMREAAMSDADEADYGVASVMIALGATIGLDDADDHGGTARRTPAVATPRAAGSRRGAFRNGVCASAHRDARRVDTARLIRRAEKVGPATGELVTRILEGRPTPSGATRPCSG